MGRGKARPSRKTSVIMTDDEVGTLRCSGSVVLYRPITYVGGVGRVTEAQVSSTPGYNVIMRDRRRCWNDLTTAEVLHRSPFQPGTHFAVREVWTEMDPRYQSYVFDYRADRGENWTAEGFWGWRSAAVMPREAVRMTCTVAKVDVLVDRLIQGRVVWAVDVYLEKN